MQKRTLQFGCLLLLSVVLFGHTPAPTAATIPEQTPARSLPYRSMLAVGKVTHVKFNCPSLGNFWLSYVDFGWVGGSCSFQHIVEVYMNYSGPAFTDAISVESEVRDESDYGSYSSYYWDTFNPGYVKNYFGQNWEEWNDSNCNNNIDYGELNTHTYYITGNSICPI